jgi:CBS domain-containing protein
LQMASMADETTGNGNRPLRMLEPLIHDVETLEPDASCADAARLMRDENIGSVVVARDGTPVGIITDRDLALRVVADAQDPNDIRVEEVMSPHPIFVSSRRTVEEVLKTMRELGVRRVPVVDDGGRLQGIVTMDDILTHLARQIGQLGEAIERELELGRF